MTLRILICKLFEYENSSPEYPNKFIRILFHTIRAFDLFNIFEHTLDKAYKFLYHYSEYKMLELIDRYLEDNPDWFGIKCSTIDKYRILKIDLSGYHILLCDGVYYGLYTYNCTNNCFTFLTTSYLKDMKPYQSLLKKLIEKENLT